MQYKYLIRHPYLLENYLKNELQDSKLDKITQFKGSYLCQGELEEIIKLGLTSYVSSRIYLKLTDFKVFTVDQLYKKIRSQKWSDFLDSDLAFKVQTQVSHLGKRPDKEFKNSLFLSQKIKDGIVDYFQNKNERRPDVDLKDPDVQILVSLKKAGVGYHGEVYIDLFGRSLSHRGYRTESMGAPLRENLASAIMQEVNWNPSEEVLIDSMCGSGTLLIEGLLHSYKISPQYLNIKNKIDWSFLKFPSFQEIKNKFIDIEDEIFADSDQKLKQLISNPPIVLGNDMSRRSLAVFEEAAKIYGFKFIKTLKKDALKLEPMKDKTGVIICNPPYGLRLSDPERVKELYYEYGENLKNSFKGHRAYIFTGSPELKKEIKLKEKRKIPFINGDLDSRLLQYDLY